MNAAWPMAILDVDQSRALLGLRPRLVARIAGLKGPMEFRPDTASVSIVRGVMSSGIRFASTRAVGAACTFWTGSVHEVAQALRQSGFRVEERR